MNSFYSDKELAQLGLKKYGKNVLISRKASIYGAENISVGDHVRVDDFCILSGKISLGSYIHISAYTALYGGDVGIVMKDFSGISSRCAVYAISDDYSGAAMTNAMVPEQFRDVIGDPVVLEPHVIVGSGSTVMPNVIIGKGTAVGSMSFVNRNLDEWGVYAGVPCRRIKERSRELLKKENALRSLNNQ